MKKWLFTITSHLLYVFGLSIFFILSEIEEKNELKLYLYIIPRLVFIINLITPFVIHVRFRFYNSGRGDSGGPLYILWNYIRGNNSHNGEEEIIYARTVIIIAAVSLIWIILNKFFLS